MPPYSPELNPAEKVWELLKKPLTNKSFRSLDMLREHLDSLIKEIITTERIKNDNKLSMLSKVNIRTHVRVKMVLDKGKEFNLAIPSREHYLPLLYILGLMDEQKNLTFFNDKLEMNSISITSFYNNLV